LGLYYNHFNLFSLIIQDVFVERFSILQIVIYIFLQGIENAENWGFGKK